MTAPLTRDELLSLPVTTDLPTLGRAFGVSEPTVRQWYHSGELEGIRVFRVGQKLRVVTADLWQLLGYEVAPAVSNNGGQPLESNSDGYQTEKNRKDCYV